MDVRDYINEAYRQLNSRDHCKILNKNPTKTNPKLVNDNAIGNLKSQKEKLLKEKIADGLKVPNRKTPKYSVL